MRLKESIYLPSDRKKAGKVQDLYFTYVRDCIEAEWVGIVFLSHQGDGYLQGPVRSGPCLLLGLISHRPFLPAHGHLSYSSLSCTCCASAQHVQARSKTLLTCLSLTGAYSACESKWGALFITVFLFGTWISLHSMSPSFSLHLHYSRAWTDLMSVSPVRLEVSWRQEACLFPHMEYTQQGRLDALFIEQRSRAASGPGWPSVVEGPSLHFCKEAGPTLAQWQETPGTLWAQHRCCSTRSVMLAGDASEDSPAGSWAGNRQEPGSLPRGNPQALTRRCEGCWDTPSGHAQ